MPLERGSDEARRIARAMATWCQGDVAVDVDVFVHLANPGLPLTEAAEGWAEGRLGEEAASIELIESVVDGIAVVSQTCDLVRDCIDRPYVEVVPLVRVDAAVLQQIRRLKRPRYAYVPGAADRGLVADLDRVMTVEKSIVATWERTPGCSTDRERRDFAEALARKRSRPAFPDDFVAFVTPLTDELRKRAGKGSDEGRAVDALIEIRVDAKPCWGADQVELQFLFVRFEDVELGPPPIDWSDRLERWLGCMPDDGRFRASGVVVPFSRITALEYCRSQRLDLDQLSSAR